MANMDKVGMLRRLAHNFNVTGGFDGYLRMEAATLDAAQPQTATVEDTAYALPNIKPVATADGGRGLAVDYPVTASMCLGAGDAAHLSGGWLVSVFDSVSTYCLCASDQTFRPGVSVLLSMEFSPDYQHHAVPGAVITVLTTPVKMGKAISIATCLVTCSTTSAVLATGKHVKYMPMALPLWDCIFQERFRKATGAFLDAVTGVFVTKGVDETAALSAVPVNRFVQLDNVAEEPDGSWSCQFTAEAPKHANPMGALHGGCGAIVAEQLALRHATGTGGKVGRRGAPKGGAPGLRSVKMLFHKPGKGRINVTAKASLPGAASASAVLATEVSLTNKNGQLIAGADFIWETASL